MIHYFVLLHNLSARFCQILLCSGCQIFNSDFANSGFLDTRSGKIWHFLTQTKIQDALNLPHSPKICQNLPDSWRCGKILQDLAESVNKNEFCPIWTVKQTDRKYIHS